MDLILANEKRSISPVWVAPSSSCPWSPIAARWRSFALIFAFFFLSLRALASMEDFKDSISSMSLSSSFTSSGSPSSEDEPSAVSSSGPGATTPPRSLALSLPSRLADFLIASRLCI